MAEQVKLLLSFDIQEGVEQAYRRFVLEELLPQAQELGLIPTDAWHTAYGTYPARLLGLLADDLDSMNTARRSRQWQDLMHKLEGYTLNLTQRVVTFRNGFQW